VGDYPDDYEPVEWNSYWLTYPTFVSTGVAVTMAEVAEVAARFGEQEDLNYWMEPVILSYNFKMWN
jgi:hypothetical protein